MKKLIKLFCLVLYYCFLQFLPAANHRGTRWIGKMRATICKGIFAKLGRNVNIEKKAYFGTGGQIQIGDNSGIGVNCHIYGAITIGRDVMMGPDVIIMTQNHKIDRLDIPMWKQGNTPIKPVIIGDDVWIGARAIILPGVKIGKCAIVGAGAIVTKEVPDYAIVGGIPAKIIKYRNQK